MSVKELLKKIEQKLLKDRELSEGRYCTYMKLVHQALAECNAVCEWTYDDVHDKWDTGCGQAWHFPDSGTPKENKMGFCPYEGCGHKIKEVK